MKERIRVLSPFLGGLIGHSMMTVLSDIGVSLLVVYVVGIAFGILMWKGLAYSLSEE
jgi:hypothetical protein